MPTNTEEQISSRAAAANPNTDGSRYALRVTVVHQGGWSRTWAGEFQRYLTQRVGPELDFLPRVQALPAWWNGLPHPELVSRAQTLAEVFLPFFEPEPIALLGRRGRGL